jgi:predicted DNA-binding transcriptional regulator YafY
MNSILQRAMHNSDELVVELDYTDSKGIRTHRVVSPIRFLPGGRFLGICLCREEPRQFHLNRCSNVTLHRAENYLMPMPMMTSPILETVSA